MLIAALSLSLFFFLKKKKITDYSLLQEEHMGFIYLFNFTISLKKKVTRIE
jgi:hypothetical protein